MMKDNLFGLIKKYGVSGPRYTSYPPAPVFTPTFGPDDFVGAIQTAPSEGRGKGFSLYFHIPFCDTLCYFCGCTTTITHNAGIVETYLSYLKKEIDLVAPLIGRERKIIQMHWGGGTPTYLTPQQIRILGEHIRKSFLFDPDAEVSVEVDPRELTFGHLQALREVGFNRMSVGVQDFERKVQEAVNRVQSEELTLEVIEWGRTLGFKSLNVDLIYGLPLQTAASFGRTLDKIVKIAPDRIAVYNFAYVPWIKKHHKLIQPEELPSSETKINILISTIEKLGNAGYEYIGMDHFAKPTDELSIAQKTKSLHRNFQGYSTRSGADLYGLGMSSISHFGSTYAQNAKTLQEYYAALEIGRPATHLGYRMTPDDEIRKYVIMRLMCDLMLDKGDAERRFGIAFDDYFSDSLSKLDPLVADGLVLLRDRQIHITALGRLFLRNIAMCFDAYIEKAHSEHRLYSQTV